MAGEGAAAAGIGVGRAGSRGLAAMAQQNAYEYFFFFFLDQRQFFSNEFCFQERNILEQNISEKTRIYMKYSYFIVTYDYFS